MVQLRALKRSFTLIELLVVISIIALLIALLLPALGKARSVAQGVGCMSNARQYQMAISTYLFDNNGWFCRAADATGIDGPKWDHSTYYFRTLFPYFNDWDILIDPARNNDPEEAIRRTNRASWPAMDGRPNNYWVVGHSYMFWDPRIVNAWQGLRTKIDDIVVPSKTLLTNCILQGRGGDWGPWLWGCNKANGSSEDIVDENGGVHNGTETYVFVDGHGDFYSTKPISEDYPVASTGKLTYPPRVTPSEAEFWTMPYYPDAYPWQVYTTIFP